MRRLLALLALTALVASAHLWLLADLPAWSRMQASNSAAPATAPAPFDTRTITPLPPPPPAPAPPPPVPPKPRPPAPQPPRPVPVAAPAPVAASVTDSAAPEAQEASAEPVPDTTATTGDAAEPVRTGEPAETAAATPLAGPPAPDVPPPGITLRSAPGEALQTGMAYQAPASVQLQFRVQGQVKGFTYSASARLQWSSQGQTYQARQEISAFLLGARAQSSQGRITGAGLQPERFEDLARKKLRAATLDWQTGQAHFEPEAPPVALAPGTQDRLSVFLQLAGMLAAAPERYPTGAEITLPTASIKAVEPWTFRVLGVAPPEPGSDTPDALLLERLPRSAGDQKAELWLAPALDFLPVRIRLSEDNGDFADLRLQSHTAP